MHFLFLNAQNDLKKLEIIIHSVMILHIYARDQLYQFITVKVCLHLYVTKCIITVISFWPASLQKHCLGSTISNIINLDRGVTARRFLVILRKEADRTILYSCFIMLSQSLYQSYNESDFKSSLLNKLHKHSSKHLGLTVS